MPLPRAPIYRSNRSPLWFAFPGAPLSAIPVHHDVHGPPLGYVGIGLAACASWAGIPGPGEPVLVAAGILAARGRLGLFDVVLAAWLGATIGGMGGWAFGRRAGHRLAVAPGPFHRQRIAALGRGERFFSRLGILAVYFAPSWVAGTTGMRARRFIPANAASAAVWAALLGIGAYAVGPSIADVVGDIGRLGLILLVALAVAGTAHLALRRRRRG